MIAKLLAAVAAGLVVLTADVSRAGPIAFSVTDTKPVLTLFVGEFKPGTLDRGPINAQTPALRRAVSGLGLIVAVGGETGCGSGKDEDADLALAAPNVSAAGLGDTDLDCLFAAELTISTANGPERAIAQCDGWHNDISQCAMDGDIGGFALRRHEREAATLDLLLGFESPADIPTGSAGPIAPPADQAPAEPALTVGHGIMLDAVADDSGRAIADSWLLLPPNLVTVGLKR